jgi:hypothetical protein
MQKDHTVADKHYLPHPYIISKAVICTRLRIPLDIIRINIPNQPQKGKKRQRNPGGGARRWAGQGICQRVMPSQRKAHLRYRLSRKLSSAARSGGYRGRLSRQSKRSITAAKRKRIPSKNVFRNTREGYDDLAIEIACALHNNRTRHRNA